MRSCVAKSVLAVGVATVFVAAGTSLAVVASIADGNSTVAFDTTSSSDRVGMTGWNVDGTEQLYNQWFWFRVGESGPEQRLNVLPEIFSGAFNTNADPRPDTLTINYGSTAGLEIDTTFRVNGGTANSHRSDVTEQLQLTNHGTTQLSLHFFQYCDFDLGGEIPNDFVSIDSISHNRADQGNGLIALSETVLTPMPSNWEVGVYSSTINKLDDANPDSLSGLTGPLVGRQDYTWAFQWDITLNPGDSFLISKDKNLSPTPGVSGLLGIGALVAMRRRRR
jgi:hypothetical protein